MKKLYAKWYKNGETIDVEVLAVASGYAMVRRKGCFPFVVTLDVISFYS